MPDRGTDAFDENLVHVGLIVDVCEFAWFCVDVISKLYQRQAGRLGVLQDCRAHFGDRIVTSKLVKEVIGDLRI